jgi:hypothetical protein
MRELLWLSLASLGELSPKFIDKSKEEYLTRLMDDTGSVGMPMRKNVSIEFLLFRKTQRASLPPKIARHQLLAC